MFGSTPGPLSVHSSTQPRLFRKTPEKEHVTRLLILNWQLLTVFTSVAQTATATLVGLSVAVTGTVATPVTRLQRTVEEGPYHPLGVETRNAGHHVNSEAGKHCLGTIAHSPSENDRHPLLT